MCLDRAHAHEELARDLPVRTPPGCQLGHALLGLRQLVGRRRAAADPSQSGPCLLRPEAGAELLEDRERVLVRLPRGALLLRLAAHRAEAEQRASTFQRESLRIDERALERRFRGREIADGREQQAPTPRRGRPRIGAPHAFGSGLVRLEVGTRPLQLAKAHERLDRVGPHRERRIVHLAGEQARREVTQVVAGALQIAELELQAPEDAERPDDEDLVGDRLGVCEHLVHGGARFVDETEIGLEQRLRSPGPVLGVRMLRLLRQLGRGGGMLERPGPVAGEPFDHAHRPQHSSPRPMIVAATPCGL